jgi:two-component system response regulator FlrC
MHGARLGQTARLAASGEAKLAAYSWPGNVREMENVIQRALIVAPGDVIEGEHLLLSGSSMGVAAPAGFEAPSAAAEMAPEAAAAARQAIPANMKDLERVHILETLAKVGGSRKKAVEALGISERTLRYKLKQYKDEGYL